MTIAAIDFQVLANAGFPPARFASGDIIFAQGRNLMVQALDPGLGKLTGTPSTIFNRELDAPNGFERVGVSMSENGVAVFQSISDAAS